MRVLVVDDDDLNREIIADIIELECDQFDEAENGQQACEMVLKGNYDIIFMDLMMPVMDGLIATKTIRDNYPIGTPPRIIAVTAKQFISAAQLAIAGFDDFVQKPFTEVQIVKHLH